MKTMVRRFAWPGKQNSEALLTREWLVTNGLGGYAAGTLGGIATRRFHGVLIAALPAPLGRTMMLNQLREQVSLPDGTLVALGSEAWRSGQPELEIAQYFAEFRLEAGLPVWRYVMDEIVLEKRLLMPFRQNTVYMIYQLLEASQPVTLQAYPGLHLRPHEGPLDDSLQTSYSLTTAEECYEIHSSNTYPPLRLQWRGAAATLTLERGFTEPLQYVVEDQRGYDSRETLWYPGYFTVTLQPQQAAVLVASTESWSTMGTLLPDDLLAAEYERRERLLSLASPPLQTGVGAELVLAADQFLIIPAGRIEEAMHARSSGEEARTMIAGYHWFTDWGRDTMIALEGLTLATGRFAEAAWILRTFAHYVRDGLIPNMFPEGERTGMYHTADATLWFFHALDRYVQTTGDQETLRVLLPILQNIVQHHLHGTRFGIGVDPHDGLLHQGAEGYQLTWMDAKVGDWVVTPRRGKAVEINALWFNALCTLYEWLQAAGEQEQAQALQQHAEQVYHSFNQRFWYPQGGYLYDVIDGEEGDDRACRPNQVLAFSLRHPVLEAKRWWSVLEVVQAQLLTPVGLRSLANQHPDYKATYTGDLRARDAAYHQGTVWAWLIGPFIDAWLRVHPEDRQGARQFLSGFEPHLNEACIGSISEIFDAETPFTPRGCVAQAWSVAEVLRCWLKVHKE